MGSHRTSIVLAVAFVLAGSYRAEPASTEPHVLTLTYQDGHIERIPATTGETCEIAIAAIRAERWRLDSMPVAAQCAPGNAFQPGWDTIAGFNRPGAGR